MTSLKKPLIAIASAVALVTTALVAAPANAAISAAVTVGTTDVATTSQVVTTPATPTVPSDNKVDLADTVKFIVTVATGTSVRVVATDAKLVTALDTADAPVTSGAGRGDLDISSGSGTTVTFYAFTTKTTTGSVVVSNGGSSATYYLKGVAGPAYNLTASAPTFAGLGLPVDFTANVTDVFGNAVTNASISTAVFRGSVTTALAYDATDKRYEGVLTTPATATKFEADVTISATDVAGLPKAVKLVTLSIDVADLATQVVALNAAIAAKDAELAALKAKYNSLAKRYNTKVGKKLQVKPVK